MAGLNPTDARIFRITHIDNVTWLLEHGLHCKNSDEQDPGFVSIGSVELIKKRVHREVECGPGGTLADYVPFYFTPYSIMMYKISTGHGGVIHHPNKDIVVLTSSIHRLVKEDIPFVFYDGHAYMEESTCYTSVDDLEEIDWPLLRSRNFSNDPDDPGKKGRYQAEALVHEYMPATALQGIGCYNSDAARKVDAMVKSHGLTVPVKVIPGWYF
jgi:hypothetical protein